jgi:hypothetical protein
MRTTQDYVAGTDYGAIDDPRGIRWVALAAVLLGLAGIWNLIEGVLAVSDSNVYARDTTFVFSHLHTWGWIMLILGVLQLVAAGALVSGNELARWFGIACAGVNAIGQLMFIPVYPWWGASMFTLDVLIIYGLALYGGARLREA